MTNNIDKLINELIRTSLKLKDKKLDKKAISMEIKHRVEWLINEENYIYKKDYDSLRLEEILKWIQNSKQIFVNNEWKDIQIEYIEIPAKKKEEGKEKVIVIIPWFWASYIPFRNTVKELAQYMGNYRIICLSPLNSWKSSSLKNSNLNKIKEIYIKAFQELGINSDNTETTVMGHSMADIVTLELARSNPEIIKNIVLVNWISANKGNLPKITNDFLNHVNFRITPIRVIWSFKWESETAKNYWKQTLDFLKNIINPTNTLNQFKLLAERRKINLEDLLSQLKSNTLVLTATKELTDYNDVRNKIYNKLPDGIKKQHRIEVWGLHDEIIAHPEAFTLKLMSWLWSLESGKTS